MLNTKGFTLIEIIIVTAIIAVLSSVFISTFSQISSSQAKKSASDISGLLSYARVKSISGEIDVKFVINQNNDGYFGTVFSNGKASKEEKIAQSGAIISYTNTSNAVTHITNNSQLTVSYDLAGSLSAPQDLQSININFDNIEYKISITPETGYHEIVYLEKAHE